MRRALLLAAVVAGCGGGKSRPTPTPSPTRSPSPSPTPTPSPSASPTPSPSPSPTPAGPQSLEFPAEDWRKGQPAPAQVAAFQQTPVQQFALDNGIQVLLVERHTIPTVTMQLSFEGGAVTDPADRPGLASMCMQLMTDGTEKLDKLAFEAALADLASSIGSDASVDQQSISLSALKRNLDPTLELFVDSLLHPGMRQDELDLNMQRRIESLRAVRGSVGGIAGRVSGSVIYGPEHAHGRVITEAAVRKYTLDACKTHVAGLRPKGATLFVAGDITADEIKSGIGARLAGWTGAPGKVPAPGKPAPRKQRIFFVDVPGAPQSVVALMHVGPPRKAADYFPTMIMASVLGIGFASRINMNIREQKGYAYGARGGFEYTRKFGIYSAGGSIRTADTVAAVREILGEIKRMRDGGPDDVELLREKNGTILALPARFETAGATLGTVQGLRYFGLPLDYYATYIGKVDAVSKQAAAAAAKKWLKPGDLRLLVVGDGRTVLPGLTELAKQGVLGKRGVTLLDPDGIEIKPAKNVGAGGPPPASGPGPLIPN